jgi:hypothetical protein
MNLWPCANFGIHARISTAAMLGAGGRAEVERR